VCLLRLCMSCERLVWTDVTLTTSAVNFAPPKAGSTPPFGKSMDMSDLAGHLMDPSSAGDPMNMGSLRMELNMMSHHLGSLAGGGGSGAGGSGFFSRLSRGSGPGSGTFAAGGGGAGGGGGAAVAAPGPGGGLPSGVGRSRLAGGGGGAAIGTDDGAAAAEERSGISDSEDDLDHDMMILGTTPSFLKGIPRPAGRGGAAAGGGAAAAGGGGGGAPPALAVPQPPDAPARAGAVSPAPLATAGSGGFVSSVLGSGPLHQSAIPARSVPDALQQPPPGGLQSVGGGALEPNQWLE
jgi:hypothetical protein